MPLIVSLLLAAFASPGAPIQARLHQGPALEVLAGHWPRVDAGLPRIDRLTDLYNAISMAALDDIATSLGWRFAAAGFRSR